MISSAVKTKAKIIDVFERETAIEAALELLRQESPVVLPTETVYGLAADARSGSAVKKIYEIKSRPLFNPLIAHVSSIAMVERYCIIDPLSKKLMEAFWPGPLTVVLPLKENAKIHPVARAGLSTIAVRCPCGVFQEIVARFDAPLVAPSANLSGRLSPTDSLSVFEDLGEKVSLILDGGRCKIGIESTIVKVFTNPALLLRPGGIARKAIEEILETEFERRVSGKIESPGQLTSHYAPRAKLRLNAEKVNLDEALLGFGPQVFHESEAPSNFLNLSPTGALEEAAVNLFSYLKALDKENIKVIAVQKIPNIGLGEGINDRLMRAAAPRP